MRSSATGTVAPPDDAHRIDEMSVAAKLGCSAICWNRVGTAMNTVMRCASMSCSARPGSKPGSSTNVAPDHSPTMASARPPVNASGNGIRIRSFRLMPPCSARDMDA